MQQNDIFICAVPDAVNITGKALEMGDRFDAEGYLKRKQITEGVIETFKRYGRIIPLTPENYANCIANRPAGTVGSGFTAAELVELGIIKKEEAPPAAPIETKKAERQKKPKADSLAQAGVYTRFGEPQEYGGQLIWTVKQGKFTLFEVTNKDGDLLRPSRFRKIEKAHQFIDGLAAAPDSAKPASEIPGKDQVDGVQLQPGSE